MNQRVIIILGVVFVVALTVEARHDFESELVSGAVAGVGQEGKAIVLTVNVGDRQGRVKVPPIASLLSHVPAQGETGAFRAPRDGTGDWRLNTLSSRFPFTAMLAIIFGAVGLRLTLGRTRS